MPSLKEVAEKIISGLEELEVTGWANCEQECGTCNGKGTVPSFQDGMWGQDWCSECGGNRITHDDDKMQAMKMDLICGVIRDAGLVFFEIESGWEDLNDPGPETRREMEEEYGEVPF